MGALYEKLIGAYENLIGTASNYLYSYVLIILLVGGGIFFTIRTKGVQIRYLIESIRVILEPSEKEDESISAFQALMVSTASRVGTGNIAGISTAICFGGPGAIFWMWMTAILGSATAFVESTLAQIYKRRAEDGSCYGGPSYYIEAVLKKRWLGVLYAVFMILTYMIGFNLVASFNVADSFKAYSFYNPSMTPLIIGIIQAAVFGLCISGGGKQIAKITGILVPVMGALYIAAALLMIALHGNMIPAMFASIFEGAFDIQAIFGGFMGSVVMLGIKRGLFSNEAGVGASATAAGSAGVSHPVKQGLVQVLSVFIDTIVICSATAFLLLCSGVEPSADMAGMPYVQAAMNNVFGTAGVVFITIALILFAFTTLLGNYYFAETGMAYLCGKIPGKSIRYAQRVLAVLIVLIGSIASLGIVWDTADVLMGLMAVINVPVVFLLVKPAVRCLDDYRAQKKESKNPVFKAANIDLKEDTDFWR